MTDGVAKGNPSDYVQKMSAIEMDSDKSIEME